VRMALMEQWMGIGETTSADGDGPSGGLRIRSVQAVVRPGLSAALFTEPRRT
jgi:hypothetical protein